MNLFNEFFLLYKSNAKEIIDGNKKIEQSTKETEKALKDTGEEANRLGERFIKVIEAGATAAGALAGLTMLKNSVATAADYNAQLELTGKLYNQNADAIKRFAQAAANAGGSKEGALSDAQGFFNKYAEWGTPKDKIPSIEVLRQRARDVVKTYPEGSRLQVLKSMGWNDPGNQRLILSSNEEFSSFQNGVAQQHVPEGSLDFTKSQGELATATNNLWTKIGETLLPAINSLVDKISSLLNGISGTAAGAVGLGVGYVGAKSLAGRKIAQVALESAPAAAESAEAGYAAYAAGAFGTSAATAAGGIGLLGGAAAAGGIIAGAAYSSANSVWTRLLARTIINHKLKSSRSTVPLSTQMSNPGGDLGFWLSQGYTPAQAAGIMANMKAESGGDATARGDSGLAHGLFQWHPDRRMAILKATGIDISNAGHADQLKAAAWEMKNGRPGFNDSYFRGLNDPSIAAAYFSDKFESPRDKAGQALARAKSAVNMASNFSMSSALGGGGNTIRIDKIDIMTQATNAAGIAQEIGSALNTVLSTVSANYDNGRAK